jgi:hypothetical protein
MNANKLFKILGKSSDSFNNLPLYKQILERSDRIVLDLEEFKSFNAFIDESVSIAKLNGLSSPYDNILFDISNIEIFSITSGLVEKQNLLLHVMPIEITTDISTFSIMLVQDMRQVGKDIYPRAYIVSLDSDVICMPAVDRGMTSLECKCFINNPFSHSPLFKQIQSYTPGFVADCGFATTNCESTMPYCKNLLDNAKTIGNIAIACLVYMSLPQHKIIKITDTHAKTSSLRQMPYSVVCNEEMWNSLHTTGECDIKQAGVNLFDQLYKPYAADKCSYKNLTLEPV